jgi:hypothetical protein
MSTPTPDAPDGQAHDDGLYGYEHEASDCDDFGASGACEQLQQGLMLALALKRTYLTC